MFQPRFAPKVESGEKCRTIRLCRKNKVKVGNLASLRQWTGKPRQRPQRILREALVTKVTPILITLGSVFVGGKELGYTAEMKFAQADRFESGQDLRNWFTQTYGFPFVGEMIEWANNSDDHRA